MLLKIEQEMIKSPWFFNGESKDFKILFHLL